MLRSLSLKKYLPSTIYLSQILPCFYPNCTDKIQSGFSVFLLSVSFIPMAPVAANINDASSCFIQDSCLEINPIFLNTHVKSLRYRISILCKAKTKLTVFSLHLISNLLFSVFSISVVQGKKSETYL